MPTTEEMIAALDRGEIRVAEPAGDDWIVNAEAQVDALMRVSPLIPAAHRLRALVVRRRRRPRAALKSALIKFRTG